MFMAAHALRARNQLSSMNFDGSMTMEPHLQAILAEIQEWGRDHDARQLDHGKKMLNLRPETALLVSILVRSSRRTRLLEIGTSNGYSTIWLAWSAANQGGRVVSIDHSAEKLALADANLRRANLRHLVELRHGDATQVVRSLSGPFDFVLFDSVRVAPHQQLELLVPKLTDDAIVLADNSASHASAMSPYLSLLGQLGFDQLVVPVGKGLSVACRSAARSPAQAAA
jgi:predicted O-methyltransferase YrrM